MNEHLADRTPSPTFSTADSDITELADERQSEMDDFMDDEAFVDDTSSDAGTEEGSDIFSDGHDPFYDRSPWFTLVGRLVRGERDGERESARGSASANLTHCTVHFILFSLTYDVFLRETFKVLNMTFKAYSKKDRIKTPLYSILFKCTFNRMLIYQI